MGDRAPTGLTALAAIVAIAVLAACGGSDAPPTPGEPGAEDGRTVTGSVSVQSPSIVADALNATARDLDLETRATAEVTVADSEATLDRFCAGEVAIAGSARPLTASERRVCERNGVDVRGATIGWLAVGVAVTDDLALRCLTLDELRRVWRAGSDVRQAAAIGARAAGELTLVGSGVDQPARDALVEALGVAGLRGDYVAVMGIAPFGAKMRAGAPALGFLNLELLRPLPARGLRAVAVDAGRGCVRPSAATVQDGSYGALRQPLRLYASGRALADGEAGRVYLEMLLDDYGEAVAAAQRVVPLSESQQDRARRALLG